MLQDALVHEASFRERRGVGIGSGRERFELVAHEASIAEEIGV